MCRKEKSPSHRKETEYYMAWIETLEMDQASKDRISQCLYWYLRKARRNKQGFYITSILSMALSASIPVINGLTSSGTPSFAKILVSAFAALSAFAVGLNSLYSYKEKWNRNRISAEKIKREISMFHAKAGKYSEENRERVGDPQRLLVLETEKLFADEASDWLHGQQDNPLKKEPLKNQGENETT